MELVLLAEEAQPGCLEMSGCGVFPPPPHRPTPPTR